MRPRLLLAIAATLPITAFAAPAGKVDFTAGNVTAVTADGKTRTLTKGAEITSGETIDTGSGRAQLRFSDGAQVSLQPQTQFRIDEYKYSGKGNEEEKGFFSLIKGGLRTITGLVGKKDRDNYRVTTSVATIGIRGTEYTAALGEGLNVTTGEGSVEVCNAAGCLILNSGDSGFVAPSGAAPARTETKTSLPPAATNNSTPPTLKAEINQAETPVTKTTTPSLASGSGYALALSASGDDASYYMETTGGTTGTATFASGSKLTHYESNAAGVVVEPDSVTGAWTDGTIGWGVWTGGSIALSEEQSPTYFGHYVVGKATPDADLLALETNNMVGTYSLLGYTLPSSSGGQTGAAGSVSATLTTNFGTGAINGNLSVAVGGTSHSGNWSGSISGASFTGSGSMNGCGDGACGLGVAGIFSGANAARAGMTYKIIGNTGVGNIHGAAVFKNTGMTSVVLDGGV